MYNCVVGWRAFLFFSSFIFSLLFLCFFDFFLVVFYVSFELIFFALFVYISGWGYRIERVSASFYMIFYTIFVSLPFFVYLVFVSVTCFFFPLPFRDLWFFCLLVFFVKLPVYVVHIWLPKAHVESPVGGSMILAGVLLKVGAYGVIRFCFGFVFILHDWGFYFFSVCFVGMIFSSFICFRQVDLKALVAYSSISHMGLAVAGCISFSCLGLFSSLYMFFCHGICSSCMFYLVNVFYGRVFSRRILLWGGGGYSIYGLMFLLCLVFFFNMAIPPLISFVSELFLIFSLVFSDYLLVLGVLVFVVLSGLYNVYACVCFYFGRCRTLLVGYSFNRLEFLLVFFHLIVFFFSVAFVDFLF